MAETKSATKKIDDVLPRAISAKEQVEPTTEIIASEQNYNEIIERAASIGLIMPEGSNIKIIAQILVDKLIEIDENLRPLAETIKKDKRVEELISALCQGMTIEDALIESEIIITGQTQLDDNNFNNSLIEADKFCSHHQLDHSTIDCFIQFVQEIISNMTKGKITQNTLTLFWKSFTFDKEVDQAFEAGVLKGRNINIEEMRNEREQNDGMGSIAGGASIDKAPITTGYIERIIKNKR